jgi:hypothetical protein
VRRMEPLPPDRFSLLARCEADDSMFLALRIRIAQLQRVRNRELYSNRPLQCLVNLAPHVDSHVVDLGAVVMT